jgi:hypothetical protein
MDKIDEYIFKLLNSPVGEIENEYRRSAIKGYLSYFLIKEKTQELTARVNEELDKLTYQELVEGLKIKLQSI